MTEITRVPLQPISKGTLAKLWIGVALAVLLAAGLAFAAVPDGVEVTVLEEGEGPSPTADDVLLVNYVGKLENGRVFDEQDQAPLPLEGMIEGFVEGALQMQKGGRYLIEIPSEKAYGEDARTNPMTQEEVIPANSDLVFEVELIDFMNFAEFQAQMQAMQQMMQGQAGPGGAPGDPGAGAGAPPLPPVPLPGQ